MFFNPVENVYLSLSLQQTYVTSVDNPFENTCFFELKFLVRMYLLVMEQCTMRKWILNHKMNYSLSVLLTYFHVFQPCMTYPSLPAPTPRRKLLLPKLYVNCPSCCFFSLLKWMYKHRSKFTVRIMLPLPDLWEWQLVEYARHPPPMFSLCILGFAIRW